MFQNAFIEKEAVIYDKNTGVGTVHGGIEYDNICDLSMSFSDTLKAYKAYKILKKDKEVSNINMYFVRGAIK